MWGLRNADEGKVRVIEKRKKLAARLFAAGAPTVKMNGRLLQSDNTKEVELLKEFEDVSCYRQKTRSNQARRNCVGVRNSGAMT